MTTFRNILSRSTISSIVALILAGAFTVGFLRGDIGADLFVAQFAVVTGFLYGKNAA